MGYGLFVCSHNMGRWPMAPALFERHAPKDLRGASDDTCDAPTSA